MPVKIHNVIVASGILERIITKYMRGTASEEEFVATAKREVRYMAGALDMELPPE